ncbi:BURP domain-containing protein [Artemisia annua]|uniref:BURP domain-containing protein n=1 Tax=Artemisia annua TaxID=35608 RepID=A0A2U1MQW7_ARTAN|nr:BURP domain-containing protein [Artemisia annua]
MGFLNAFTFLCLAMVVSHAEVAPETYWKSVLPNTPMPKVVTELLHNEDKTTSSVNSVGEPDAIESGTKFPTTSNQFKYDANAYQVLSFFLERDMYQGHELNSHFPKENNPSTFLPRKVAETIPFSSNNLRELYTRFAIKPDSAESEVMKKTINQCEEKGMEGEKKYCATSLEAMVDYTTSTLVFYCHKTTTTRAYLVSLVGEDGKKAKAVAICHKYAAKLYPKDMVVKAFKVLKVKPGSTPVCLFLPEDHIVWVPY